MGRRVNWLEAVSESRKVCALIQAFGGVSDASGDGAAYRSHGTRAVVGEQALGSVPAVVTGCVAAELGRPVLYVCAHLDEADDAVDDLERFTQGATSPGAALSVQRFGALEVLPGETSVSLELLAERLGVVERLGRERGSAAEARDDAGAAATGMGGRHDHNPQAEGAAEGKGGSAFPGVIVAPVQALMQAVPRGEAAERFSLTLSQGTALAPGPLIAWLDHAGYERKDAVETPGDFAVRGGLVDVFPPAGAMESEGGQALAIGPVRVDFFGDEVDTLTAIDPDSLASTTRLASARLVGASAEAALQMTDTASLMDLLPRETVVVLHESMELAEQARGYYERLTNPVGVYAPKTVFAKLKSFDHAELNRYSPTREDATRVALPASPLPTFDTDAKSAIAELAELAADETNDVRVLCRRPAERDRLIELLDEEHPHASGRISIEVGSLHRGFVWGTKRGSPTASGEEASSSALVLIPHHELFHRYETARRVRRVSASSSDAPGASRQDAFLDLEVGDYVVHVDHGIARFAGLKTMRRQGKSGEYLTLEFAERAVLHVPATQIELIQKYVGGFQGKPPLSTLGGKRWRHQKEQVREAVKDLASELLRVHAARATQPGITYPRDTAWQREFEAEFPYDETEDQLAAIAAIKADMAENTPMDRLVCGDVGFGKTEVAIRAAFKAVEYGKQVAVLVPTTVLAEQHERTFRQRFADYPFHIESLSRFKSKPAQRETLMRLRDGRIDIVVGTHRLLSGDVKFADLGLVIIDEEQRFGVEHKNKLLAFRLTADVLTLTATPIPRTLHMAMVGLRDISSLSTAPVDRRAVVTEVVPYDKDRIQHALVRELSRGGQAFFVHNRVHNIHGIASEVQSLVPDARVIVGHGQMQPAELQDVMLQFIRREADVLVCTTIIESGIDIPTANTMFINQADHYGLADLHQLRGRVGRYKHRAYCYLLLPPQRSVSEVAAKRLKAIESYSMLGAGFKIAMRDLEIRGAGNLLGAEQSGHIAAVGYEMYCLLLEQETKKLKDEPVLDTAKTHLELPLSGAIPKKYIASDKHRMDAYRRLSRASSMEQFDAVVASITDAFGDPPPPARTLFDVAEVRLAATRHRIDKLKLEGPDLIFTTAKAEKLRPLFDTAPGRATVLDETTLYWRPPPNYLEPDSLLPILRKLLVRPLREPAAEPPSLAAAVAGRDG